MLCHTLSGDCLFLRYRATLHAARLTDPHLGALPPKTLAPMCVDAQEYPCTAIGGCAHLRRDLLRENPLRLPTTAAYSSTLLGLNMTGSASYSQTSLRTYLYITLPCRESRMRAAKLEFGEPPCLGLAFVRWPETKVVNFLHHFGRCGIPLISNPTRLIGSTPTALLRAEP